MRISFNFDDRRRWTGVDFELGGRARAASAAVDEFVRERVIPAEPAFYEEVSAAGPGTPSGVMRGLRDEARRAGLWNLFMHDPEWGPGLSVLEYAPAAEAMGRSLLGAETFNCQAPDSGNMEILARFGTPEQKERWLVPLLHGTMSSCFAMTEPSVASSDAVSISSTIEPVGDDLRLDGRKWWITGVARHDCAVMLFVGRSRNDGPAHERHSVVLVPLPHPAVAVQRDLSVLGAHDPEGHAEIVVDRAVVPAGAVLGPLHEGFAVVQSRLGAGRIHHCMRLVGQAERALELMVERAEARTVRGAPLADQQMVQELIARSRIEIESARLLVLKAAWAMDERGHAAARNEIAMAKVVVPTMAATVVDRAMQVHGGMGLGPDTPLPTMYAYARFMRIGDGPDEVHLLSIARHERRAQGGSGVQPTRAE